MNKKNIQNDEIDCKFARAVAMCVRALSRVLLN